MERRHYHGVSNVQSAPPPAFCLISLGTTVHTRFLTFSLIEPAAPSEVTPVAASVANTSLAARALKLRLPVPKTSSQLRAVISTSLARQATESALTEIIRLGGKLMMLLLPASNSSPIFH